MSKNKIKLRFIGKFVSHSKQPWTTPAVCSTDNCHTSAARLTKWMHRAWSKNGITFCNAQKVNCDYYRRPKRLHEKICHFCTPL